MEGSAAAGQIVDTNSTINLDTNHEWPWVNQMLGIASTANSPSEQEWLQTQSQRTDVIASNQELFKHYPEGGGVAGFGSNPNKDPLLRFFDKFPQN